ncbi:hypothetical protein ACFQ0O_26645 [Saccharopolyspora spinosporotrichia]
MALHAGDEQVRRACRKEKRRELDQFARPVPLPRLAEPGSVPCEFSVGVMRPIMGTAYFGGLACDDVAVKCAASHVRATVRRGRPDAGSAGAVLHLIKR